MDNRNLYFYRAAEISGHIIKLVQVGKTFADVDNVTGVWSAAKSAYIFTIDIDDSDIYDPTIAYDICDDDVATKLVENLILPDGLASADLVTHAALTAAHGATGAVVGTTNTQTLTGKTINGPDNTLTNLDGLNHKGDIAAHEHPSLKVKPAGGSDTVLHIDTADATTLTATAGNAAKSADRTLKLVADEVVLANRAAGAIQLSGLAAGTANGDAVRYDEFHALDLTVAGIMAGSTWTTPPPTVTCNLRGSNPGINGMRIVSIAFNLDAVNSDDVNRWDIFFTEGAVVGVSAGLTTAAILEYLTQNCHRLRIGGNESRVISLPMINGPVSVIVVAYDTASTGYNSSIERLAAGRIPPPRDAAGEVILSYETMTNYVQAGTAATNAAAKFGEYVETGTAYVIKERRQYLHRAENLRMRIYGEFYVDAASAYIKVAVTEIAGAEILAAEVSTALTAYPSTPQTLEVDLTSGLTAGKVYEIELSLKMSATGTATMRRMPVIEIEKQTQVG